MPGHQPEGSAQSQSAASLGVLYSPALISILQAKIWRLSQLMSPLPKATRPGRSKRGVEVFRVAGEDVDDDYVGLLIQEPACVELTFSNERCSPLACLSVK